MPKPKEAPKPNPKEVRIVARPGDTPAEGYARAITRPSVQAAVTIHEYADRKGETDLTVTALIDELQRHCDAASRSNLAREEAMLVAQAHTLDAIFNALARRATGQQYLKQWEANMRLALKAQSQCRTTIETLTMIKNPPIVYARQANIAAGPQQVNNGIPDRYAPAPAPAREIESTPSKLSEADHELLPDTRASALAVGGNSPLEALGAFDRAEDTRG